MKTPTNRLTAPFFVSTLTTVLAGLSLVTLTSAASPYELDPAHMAGLLDDQLAEELGHDASAPLANDATFLRRASLDIVGRVPTPEETTRFCLDPDSDKRRHIVDQLLDDSAYGMNWSRYWRDVILYRRSDEKALVSYRSVADYLQAAFNENLPWNEIATAFITAKGDAKENGATGLIMSQMARPEETVGEISRILTGIQIQCAQCHDHPTDEWTREQFHELAAFFPRVGVRRNRTGGDKQNRSFIIFANDTSHARRRKNNNNRRQPSLEHTMPNLDDPTAPGTPMEPVFFLTGRRLKAATMDAERREKLATWITNEENPWFAIAIVNRIWSELVGRGFYEPVDDLGPDRDCVAPKTLETLKNAFVYSGYNLKWLFRTVMATNVYQSESNTRQPTSEPTFAASTPQRLRGDQLFEAITAALVVHPQSDRRFADRGNGRAIKSPRGIFNATFGFDPSDPRSEITDSIPQALALMNSPIINGLINVRRPELRQLLVQTQDDGDLVYELYLRMLAREPTRAEEKQATRYLHEVGNRAEATEDLIWALVNSTEFRHKR